TWSFFLQRNMRATERNVYPFTEILSVAQGHHAHQAIRRWPDYSPTPLRDLERAAARAGVHQVLYKDEASRLGLNSFKALGGSYAVARLLQQLVSQQLKQPISLEDLASGTHTDLTRQITVACASDGNHGRAVADGARRFGCGCVVFLHEGVSHPREQAI